MVFGFEYLARLADEVEVEHNHCVRVASVHMELNRTSNLHSPVLIAVVFLPSVLRDTIQRNHSVSLLGEFLTGDALKGAEAGKAIHRVLTNGEWVGRAFIFFTRTDTANRCKPIGGKVEASKTDSPPHKTYDE